MHHYIDPEMFSLDMAEPAAVEIIIKGDGKVVWVNVEGCCAFRACRIGYVELVDYRSPELKAKIPLLASERPYHQVSRIRTLLDWSFRLYRLKINLRLAWAKPVNILTGK